MDYIKKTLNNGVKLYLYLDKNMKQCYVDYIINYGSSGKWYNFYLDDKLYHVLPGCAHFLEHILGEHSKYGNFYKYLASKKYYKNGATGPYYTHYFFKGTEDVLDSLEKLINMVDDPVFTMEDVEETKHAIIEETKITRNNKFRTLDALVLRNLYKNVELSTDTLSMIGDEETTKKIDYDMLKICYEAFYHDENKVLLVAGNFDEKEITKYIETIYKKLKPHKKKMREVTYNLDEIRKKEETKIRSTHNDLFGIGFKEKIKNYTRKEIYYYTWFIYSNVFEQASDFVIRLKKENILINITGYSSSFVFDKEYVMFINALVKNNKKFQDELLKELKTRKFSERDFNLFIREIISDQALYFDYKYKRFNKFAFRLPFTKNFNDIEFLKSLSYDKFLDFYKSLSFDEFTVGLIKGK